MTEESKLKIKKIKAVELYRLHLGVSEKPFHKSIYMDDSLLTRFLIRNKVKNSDLLCVEFDYGLGDYDSEYNFLMELKKDTDENRIQEINRRIELLNMHKEKIVPISANEIRYLFYKNGVTYDGKQYILLYRTPSKAKKGQAFFISKKFYKRTNDYMTMGIKTDKIVEIEAYKTLVASSIIGTVPLEAKNILIVKDKESSITKKIKSVEMDNGNCVVVDREQKLTNILWDGEALADESLFQGDNGMMLLRNHFFKSCAFRCDIKQYMHDNHITEVYDMFGLPHNAKDIKLICTESSCKWLKFGKTKEHYLKWCNTIETEFGIVKIEHETKWNDNKQRMSYQMVNSLPASREDVDEFCKDTKDYIENLKDDIQAFIHHIEIGKSLYNSNEILIALYKHNPEIAETGFFRNAKKTIITRFLNDKVKLGKVFVNGDNFTVLSNPMELLEFATTGKYSSWFKTEDNAIQCSTKRFDYDSYVCGFRNPHNSPNNILYLHNTDLGKEFNKYFGKLSKNIVVVNSIETEIQDRANSMDFDSDFVLLSNDTVLVSLAKKAYTEYPTIVNNIHKKSLSYCDTWEERAKIDNKFAELQNIVGEATNLAQIALSYYWDKPSKEYYDAFVILSVLAQVAIDSVKREFDIDMKRTITIIRNSIKIEEIPVFYKNIQKSKNNNVSKKPTRKFNTPMEYMIDYMNPKNASTKPAKKIEDYFIKIKGQAKTSQIGKFRAISKRAKQLFAQWENPETKAELDELLERVSKIKCSNPKTINKLIEYGLGLEKDGYSLVLLTVIYRWNPDIFLQNFKKRAN